MSSLWQGLAVANGLSLMVQKPAGEVQRPAPGSIPPRPSVPPAASQRLLVFPARLNAPSAVAPPQLGIMGRPPARPRWARRFWGILALVALPWGSLEDCPFPPILDNAVIKDEFNSLRYFRIGLKVEYVCHHRYAKFPTFTITCTAKSQWSEPDIPCTEKTCAYPGHLSNGFIQPLQEEYKIGSIVTYFCNRGFILVGHNVSECVFLRRDVKWSNPLPSCQLKCKDPVVEHGIKLSGFGPLHAYGENITFECKFGYFMIGSYITRCEENSTWFPKIPTCKKIDPELCGAPLIVSGTVHPFKPQYVSGMPITITCNLHYSFPDETMEMTTVCQGYNVWDPPVQPCLFTTSPDMFQLTISHGAIVHGKKKYYEPGDIVVITCNAGYTLIGPSKIRYIGGKKWSPHIPSCSLNFIFVLLITAFLLILLWLPALSVYQKYCKQ